MSDTSNLEILEEDVIALLASSESNSMILQVGSSAHVIHKISARFAGLRDEQLKTPYAYFDYRIDGTDGIQLAGIKYAPEIAALIVQIPIDTQLTLYGSFAPDTYQSAPRPTLFVGSFTIHIDNLYDVISPYTNTQNLINSWFPAFKGPHKQKRYWYETA